MNGSYLFRLKLSPSLTSSFGLCALALLIPAFFFILGPSKAQGESLPLAIESVARKKDLLAVFKAHKISGREAVVRLILAETMASHCEAVEQGRSDELELIMRGIASVIRNRAGAAQGEKELAVVFAQNQFNSSLAQYACSEVEVFLNPQLAEQRVSGRIPFSQLWAWAQQAYESAWKLPGFDRSSGLIKNYYLPQHHRRGGCHFKPPKWVNSKNEVNMLLSPTQMKTLGAILNQCIGFYKVP